MKDLSGKVYGRWTVIKFSHRKGKNYYWVCKCSCEKNTIKTVNSAQLNNGQSQSCGCFNKETITKHGLNGNKLYHIFNSMKARCYSTTNKSYKNYDGRGIKICDEWLNDVKLFIEWAHKNGYKEGLTIERKDVNGDYCPQNCCWESRKTQSNNTRKNIFIDYNGKTQTLTQWAEEYNIKPHTLYYRYVLKNWDIDKSLNTPIRR